MPNVLSECRECDTPLHPEARACPECLTPTLLGRRERALRALAAYDGDDGETAADPEEVLTVVGDLVADLMHLVESLPPVHAPAGSRNWSHVMASAHMHYEAEANGAGPYADAPRRA